MRSRFTFWLGWKGRECPFLARCVVRCNAMVRQLSEAERTLASQPHERPGVPGASLNMGSVEARSFFPRIGFRHDFGEGANRLLSFAKAPPGGVCVPAKRGSHDAMRNQRILRHQRPHPLVTTVTSPLCKSFTAFPKKGVWGWSACPPTFARTFCATPGRRRLSSFT